MSRWIAVVLSALLACVLAGEAAAQAKQTAYGVIRCQSPGGRFSTCPAETDRGVRLVRDLSGRCRLGQSWGYGRDLIWVDNGCDAEFEIGRAGEGYGWGGGYRDQRYVVCESDNYRREFCPADTRGGVRLLSQISRTACIEGRNWWVESRGIVVTDGCAAEFEIGRGGGYRPGPPGFDDRALRCESINGRRRYCRADIGRGRVEVLRQLSDARCIHGRSWGWDAGGVWVDDGCRAEFAIDSSGGRRDGGHAITVRCESRDYRRSRCPIGPHRDVVLARQISVTRCLRDRNWGVDRNAIWVDHGCAGEFRVH